MCRFTTRCLQQHPLPASVTTRPSPQGFQFGCGSACTKYSGKSLRSPLPTPSFLPAATARSRKEHVIATDKSAASQPEASIMTSPSPSYKPVAGSHWCYLWIAKYTMAVGPGELIRPLTGLVFIPAGCRATLLTCASWWGSQFRRRTPVHVAGCTLLTVAETGAPDQGDLN